MQCISTVGDWMRQDIQHCRFKNYDLTYAFYSKFPSWGCQDKLCTFTAKLLFSSRFISSSDISKDILKNVAISPCDVFSFILFLAFIFAYGKVQNENKAFKHKFYPSDRKYTKIIKKLFFNHSSLFHIYFNFFFPLFSFNDFGSPLILFSWWRNKISWG